MAENSEQKRSLELNDSRTLEILTDSGTIGYRKKFLTISRFGCDGGKNNCNFQQPAGSLSDSF